MRTPQLLDTCLAMLTAKPLMQANVEPGTAQGLLQDVKTDWDTLAGDMQRLVASLSTSVHEATGLTLEHTLLYDSAVEVLQVTPVFAGAKGLADDADLVDACHAWCVMSLSSGLLQKAAKAPQMELHQWS